MEKKLMFAALICAISSYYGAAGVPSVEVIPDKAVVLVGQDISLLCRSGKPIQYCRFEHVDSSRSWNLRPNVSRDGLSYHGAGLQEGQCGITLHGVEARSNGQYRCTMGFPESTDEAIGTMNLTVAVAPSIPDMSMTRSRHPSGDFQDGDKISASCIIRDGRPVSELAWYIGNEQITSGLPMPEIVRVDKDDLYSIKQNVSYTVSWEDNGKTLKCVAQHVALQNRTSQATVPINVRFPPRPQKDLEMFGFNVGKPGVIEVEIKANPMPTVSWIINDLTIQGGARDSTGRFDAALPEYKESGTWAVKLHITTVSMEDIESKYTLKVYNDMGEESYTIKLSTNSEPTVLPLHSGAIIGIVVAILGLLLAIILLIFARARGRWCFAGGVSARQDPKESSDTESADHGPTQRSKKPKGKFSNIFKKKSDKVGDDTEMTKPTTMDDEKELERAVVQSIEQPQVPQQQPKQGDNIVYAELDLKDLKSGRRPQVRAEDEKTEYAEIVYTTKPEEESNTQ